MKPVNKAIGEIRTLLKQVPNRSRNPKNNRYPKSIKDAVCKAVAQGSSPRDIGRLTGISNSAIYKWLRSQPTVSDDLKAVTDIQRIEVLPALDSCQVQLPTGVTISFSGPLVSQAFEVAVLRGLS